MTTETALTTKGDKELALYELETRFAMAVRQRQLLESYIRERLKPDKHFYTVGDDPKQKPSLTKEGAELICLPHNLKGHYEWLAGPESPTLDDSPYQITMKCCLENNGKFEGEGVGSASSMITKKDGTRIQRQKDPGLRHNATIKMACKSAYIAATLNSTAASEFFTQDLEDDETGESKKEAGEKEHWCSIHNIAFTKKKGRGGSEFWSHKTDDGWCNEAELKPEKPKETATSSMAEQEQGPTEQKGKPLRDPKTIKTKNDMTLACHQDFGMSQTQWIKEAGYKSFEDIAEPLSEIYMRIREVKGGVTTE